MSTQGGDIQFTFSGNAAQLLETFKKIDTKTADTGDKAVKSIGKIKTAYTDVDVAAKKLTTSASRLESVAGRAGSGIMKLSGAIGIFNPEAAGMVRNLGDVADVGEVAGAASKGFGVSLASMASVAIPVAAAIAALALAWHHYAGELAEAEAAQKSMSDIATAAQTASLGLQAVEDDLALAIRRQGDANADSKIAYEKRTVAIEAAIAAEEAMLGHLDNQTAMDAADALADKRQRLLDQAAQIRDAEIRASTARDAATAATKRQTEAEAELAAIEAERTAGMADDTRLNNEALAALASLRTAEQSASDATLTGIAKVEAAREAALASQLATYQAGVAAASGNAQLLTELNTQYEDARVATVADAAMQIQAIHAETAEKAAQLAKDQLETWQAAQVANVSASADTAGALSGLFAEIADNQGKESRKGAKAAFAASQAFAVIQVGISTALAVMNALATVPYPAALGASAAAGIAGITQLAVIASAKAPSFHSGGTLYPDEAMVKVKSGESVLTPEATQANGGAAGVAAMNAGHSSGGSGSSMIRIGRHVFSEGLRTDIRAGGIMTQEMDRRIAMGGREAGVSGKVARA